MQTERNRPSNLILLAAIFLGLIVAFHLGNAFAGKSLFRAVHLGTALEYARHPIDLLRPVIVGFNATGTPAALELPLWQAVVGMVFKVTHSTWYGWGNLVSLFFFTTGLWPFFQLARSYIGERAAWWSLIFFLAQPLIVIWSGLASTDGFCLVLTIWFLFFADKMIRTNNLWWWLPTVLFASLGAVSKAPFFMAAGLCSIFLPMTNGVWKWRPWLLLAMAGGIATAIFFVWTHYTDSLLAQAEYPFVDLQLLQGPHFASWYLGDLHYRLSLGHWIKGGWRFLHATLGGLPFVILPIAALLRPGNPMPKLWLLATFITTLVFAQVVLVHWHYYLMCCPAVAMLCGITLARWEDYWTQEMPNPQLRLALAGMVLIFSAIDGVIATKVSIYYDSYPQEMSAILLQHTNPQDKLIVYGGDWGGEMLFRSQRQGFYVSSLTSSNGAKGLPDLLDSETDLHRLKTLGYDKLVLLSESPAWFAASAINPGSKARRGMYPATISKIVDAWPVIYHSEDIEIKEIPDEPPLASGINPSK